MNLQHKWETKTLTGQLGGEVVVVQCMWCGEIEYQIIDGRCPRRWELYSIQMEHDGIT
jgi:hypothetical protein